MRQLVSRIDAKTVLRLLEAFDYAGVKRQVVLAMFTSWQKAPRFPVWGQMAGTEIRHAGIWPG